MNSILYFLLKETIEKGSSDLHVKTNSVPWVRIKTEMKPLNDIVITNEHFDSILLELLNNEKKKNEFYDKGDIDLGYHNDLGHYRMNLLKEDNGYQLVVRVLPKNIPTIQELHFHTDLYKLLNYQNGLILVTGATSNGKSTTLASIINEINKKEHKHIITIEDPIEYRFPKGECLITQREIGRDSESFSTAFKATLREDPDVIMIGELRDKDTILTAIQAAESGHLVFSTLHTNSASETIERILSYFDSKELQTYSSKLSSILRCVISQKLIKTLDKSRMQVAEEVLIPNTPIKNLIRENKYFQISGYMRTGKQDGNMILEETLVTLVKEGLISYDQALYAANDKPAFEQLYK